MRPDGMMLIPWLRGRALVGDYTCVDTCVASAATGDVAVKAFRKKEEKDRDTAKDFIFIPIAMETLGAWTEESLSLVRELGRRIARRTGEPRSDSFLLQRISIAVQKANFLSTFMTLPSTEEMEDIQIFLIYFKL